mmetsp:Transcript_4451/g.8052  ORF Transcript_4451/g.8052 Transcript_4451/m.8052 type:complete len:120 (+) Transcript_4451:1425-1784(+)
MNIFIMGEGNCLLHPDLAIGFEDCRLFVPDFLIIGLLFSFFKVLKRNCNRKRIDIHKSDLSHTEGCRNVCTKKCRTQSHALVRVDVLAKLLVSENGRKTCLNLWNSHTTTNQFDGRNII